jgi:transcriptional regulator with XRE-family HTH domain
MSELTRIHAGKQPRRPHHIRDWAELRGLKAVDIAREIDADKSVISRWFAGATPSEDYQQRLAALFETTREGLFRHPDDDWLTKFFKDRSREEVERIKRTMETAFPKRDSAG